MEKRGSSTLSSNWQISSVYCDNSCSQVWTPNRPCCPHFRECFKHGTQCIQQSHVLGTVYDCCLQFGLASVVKKTTLRQTPPLFFLSDITRLEACCSSVGILPTLRNVANGAFPHSAAFCVPSVMVAVYQPFSCCIRVLKR